MAKAIRKYDNGLNIRYIKSTRKYYITFGVYHIQVNGEYLKGFENFQDAEDFLLTLKPMPFTFYSWTV